MNIRSVIGFAYEFEDIAIQILLSAGYKSKWPLHDMSASDSKFIPAQGFDFEGVDPSGAEVGVEIKFYRTHRPGPGVINRILEKITNVAHEAGKQKAILIVSETSGRGGYRTDFAVPYEIITAENLRSLSSGNLRLIDRLNELLRVSSLEAVEPRTELTALEPVVLDDSSERINSIIRRHDTCPQSSGPPYEAICFEAIAELFGDELGVLHDQHPVADRFHVIDLIASIKPSEPDNFWAHLRSDFRSRYIVFEFKNYKDAIGQDQIYSTEKYLFTHALRTVAIMIARNGEDDGAKHAREGALREHGKLIIGLSGADLVKMLEMKRDLDDFTGVLADNLDTMLTSLGR
ncbi:hypothetical protein [Ensifer sp. SL37]|uniref:hypothetical protein n=1 Tax=Ensifer sp. SL37 TaxID=2995137 RepID=UPI00227582AA|nr:hypothetical protein [Ensifer sp. SL37]MCY1741438.1 hypothetical protein [Ensifer sp. SL37]